MKNGISCTGPRSTRVRTNSPFSRLIKKLVFSLPAAIPWKSSRRPSPYGARKVSSSGRARGVNTDMVKNCSVRAPRSSRRRLKLKNYFHSKIFHDGINISGWSERMKFASVPSARTRKYGGAPLGVTLIAYRKPFWRYSWMTLSPSVWIVTCGSDFDTSTAAMTANGTVTNNPASNRRFSVRMITLSLCRQRSRYSSAGPAEKVDPAHEPSPPRPGGRFFLLVPRLSRAATADYLQRPADRRGQGRVEHAQEPAQTVPGQPVRGGVRRQGRDVSR